MQPPPPLEPDQSQEQLTRAYAKLTRRYREAVEHAKVLEQTAARSKQEEALLEQRLRDALTGLEIAKRSLANRMQENNKLKEELSHAQEEKDRCQRAEVKYKKKVRASEGLVLDEDELAADFCACSTML